MRDTFLPGFADDVPYVLVDVELDEQTDLRVVSRLLDGEGPGLRVGAAVRVDFDDVATGTSIPVFRLEVA